MNAPFAFAESWQRGPAVRRSAVEWVVRALKLSTLIVVAGVLFSCGRQEPSLIAADSSVALAVSDKPAVDTHLVEFLQAHRHAWQAPGLSVAVARGDQIVFSAGVGLADVVGGSPATAHTTYRIASTSKAITAVTVLSLVDQGLVRLDDDIRHYVPAFPPKEWPITVGHVLSHTSGIRHYSEGETSRKQTHYETVAEAIQEFKDDTLRFEPGTKYGYTTFGYTLLQGVVESASGMSFRQCLRERVFEVAGMTGSDLEVKGEVYPERAIGYRMDGDEIGPVGFDDVSFKYAGGGMLASAEDLVRFCMALGNGELLSDSLTRRMFDELPIEPGAGLAWGSQIDEHLGTRRVWHPGRSNGFESYLLYYPAEQLAVAVLSNQHYTDPWVHMGGVAQVLANVFWQGHDSLRAAFPVTPVSFALSRAFENGGADSARATCLAYRESPAWRHWDLEAELNSLGYQYMEGGRVQAAIDVFSINVDLYPESWNAYDSLAEAYAKNGDKDNAVKSYERSLRLNPANEAGARKLSELKQ